MHKEVLTRSQIELLPLLKEFKRNFYLVGGTAIALQLGHRRSIDFDLFTGSASLNTGGLKKKLSVYKKKKILYEASDQLHVMVNDVKITFFSYLYPVNADRKFESVARMPRLIDLASMKVFALGGRAKWKDYVDLYFILNSCYTLKGISRRASKIFGQMFSEKLLRQQLCFFEDIDYSEKIEYMDTAIDDEIIKDFLTKTAVGRF